MSESYSLFSQVKLIGGPLDGWMIETPALDLMGVPKPMPDVIWIPLLTEVVGSSSTGTLDTTKTMFPEKKIPYRLLKIRAEGKQPVFDYRYAPEEPSV